MLRQNGPSPACAGRSAKFGALFCVETYPHGDTLDATYSRLNVAEVQAVVTGSVETLIRRQVLYPFHHMLSVRVQIRFKPP
jgi:hypothetical protein